MNLIFLLISLLILFFLLVTGGSILEARGILPAEIAPYFHYLQIGFGYLVTLWHYLLSFVQ